MTDRFSMKGMSRFYTLFVNWHIVTWVCMGTLMIGAPFLYGSRPLPVILWQETIIVPAVLGLTVATKTLSVRATEGAWMIPNIRQVLHRGTWHVLFAAVAIVALMHLWMERVPFTGVGIAALTYAIAVAALAGRKHRTANAMGVVMLLCVLKPAPYVGFATTFGMPLALAALAGACVLMRGSASVQLHRASIGVARDRTDRRPARWRVWLGLEHDTDAAVDEVYRHRGTLGWVETGFNANNGTRSNWITGVVTQALWLGGMSYWLNNIVGILLPASNSGINGRGLNTQLIYPVHRKTRAMVAIASQVINVTVCMISAAIVLNLLTVLRPFGNHVDAVTDPSIKHIWPTVACMMVWLPIASWQASTPAFNNLVGSFATKKGCVNFGIMMVQAIAFMTLTLLSLKPYLRMIAAYGRGLTFGIVCACAIITHAVFVLIMRRQYYRADLV